MSGHAEITVSFRDVLEGRAYLRIPFVGKLLLFHWAGAPWSDKDPDACLHPLQVECIAHRERLRLIHGASRLGKSVLGGCDCIEELMLPFAKLAVVAGRYDHVAHEWQYLHRGMQQLFRGHKRAFIVARFIHRPSYHVYLYETLWGARGEGFSVESDEGAALLGQEFTKAVLGEGSHIATEIGEKKLLRAVDGALMLRAGGFKQRETGKIAIYTTPKGYEGWSAALVEQADKATRKKRETLLYGEVAYPQTVWIREADILENPAYDRAVYEARRKTLSKAAFDEQYRGKMTFKTGRVIPSYDDDRHRRRLPPPDVIRNMRLGVGIDTGAYQGWVLMGIDPRPTEFGLDRAWVLGETYTQQQTLDVTVEEFKEMVSGVLGPAFDNHDFEDLKEAIEVWYIDPASQHKIDISEKLDIALAWDKKELQPTLELVEELFKLDRIMISEDCTFLDDQLRKYIWKQRKAPTRGAASAPVISEPRKEYDHLVDALRIGVLPLLDLGPLDTPPPVMTFKQAWERAQRDRIHGPLRNLLREAKRRDDALMESYRADRRRAGLDERRRFKVIPAGLGRTD